MKLSSIEKQELLYLQRCGSSISLGAVKGLRDKGLITIDSPQPYSNSPYAGIAVTLTPKGKNLKI